MAVLPTCQTGLSESSGLSKSASLIQSKHSNVMEKQFREEKLIECDDSKLWWTIGLDVSDDQARPFVLYGGIAHPDAPVAVLKVAVEKWAEWLATAK